jgi:large subunit ribosomal protein L4
VVDDFALSKYSTKHIVKVLASFKAGKALLADERKDDVLYKSARNIHGAAAFLPSELNAENVLRYENLIISETALTSLQQRFEEKSSESV